MVNPFTKKEIIPVVIRLRRIPWLFKPWMNAVKSRGASVDSAPATCQRITPTSMPKLSKKISVYLTSRGNSGTTPLLAGWGSIIFLLALMLRLAYTAFLRQNYFFYDNPSSDVLYYQDWAREIARVNWIGTKTFWGLPLYPYFLAVLDRLTLGNMFFMRLFHLGLGSINCVLIYLVARQLFGGKVAVCAGILTATNFMLIYFDWIMMPVTLIIFLSLIVLLALLKKDNIKAHREWLFLGIIIGLGMLGDGKFLLFFALTIVYLIFEYRKQIREKTKHNLRPLIIGVFLVLCLTGLRNKMVGGDWIWITAQNGLSFYVGNNPQATGVYDNPAFIRPTHTGQDEDQIIVAEVLSQRKLRPGEVSGFWRSQGLSFIKDSPLAYLKLLKNKFFLFFTETEAAFDLDLLLQKQWKQTLDINAFYVICPLAIGGIILTQRKRNGIMYMNFLILSQLCFTLIFFLTNRHRATIIPFLIIYESYAIFWIIENIKTKQWKPILGMGFFCILFFIFFRPQSLDAKTLQFYRFSKTGSTYEKKKDYPNAQDQYVKALTIWPEDTNALYNLANTYVLTENFQEAERFYKEILNLLPYQVDALYNLGFVYEKTGRFAEAIPTYTKVLELQPNSPDALFQIAQIHQRQNNCLEAISYYRRVIQLKPALTSSISEIMAKCY